MHTDGKKGAEMLNGFQATQISDTTHEDLIFATVESLGSKNELDSIAVVNGMTPIYPNLIGLSVGSAESTEGGQEASLDRLVVLCATAAYLAMLARGDS
jgi:hypothetical protein